MTQSLSPKQLEQIAHNLCSLHDFDPAFVAGQEKFARAVITEFQRAAPAPDPDTLSEAVGLRAALEAALSNFDATCKMCPFNRSPSPPRDKPCPTCGAEKSEGCRREITGAFGFVYSARQALENPTKGTT